MSKAIFKRAGGDMIALTRRAQQRNGGGKQDKEIQRQIPRQGVEMPRPSHLRRHDFLKAFPGLLQKHSVIDDAGGVDDSPQRRQRMTKLGEDLLQVRPIRNIPSGHHDLGTLLLQIANRR